MLALITARLKATNTNADGKVDPGELKALTGALLLVELRTGIVSPAEDTDDCNLWKCAPAADQMQAPGRLRARIC